MKKFMDDDFLLHSQAAKILYNSYAKNQPVIDYHCHISPKEIAENASFADITQVWLGHDHYKWRLMRSAGIEERYITGDASPREKFQKWAQTLAKAIGNPLYHWSHLELKRYFEYPGVLNEKTAQEVWELCNDRLKHMRARDFILISNVKCLCTTDDPADDLRWHRQLAEEKGFPVKVLPAWRPDQAISIEKPNYTDYLKQLEKAGQMAIRSFSDWKRVMKNRMDYFSQRGCCISDHGLARVVYQPAGEAAIEEIFQKRRKGALPTEEEAEQFKTACLLYLAGEYAKRGWAMQLHYGVKRDNNRRMLESIGPDTGFDCIGNTAPANQLADFLNALDYEEALPKTILYSLNPADNETIGTIMGCFQNQEAIGKIQHGSAWWFNDNKSGMRQQMISLANLGLLSGSVGMLTDSRSFLSYTRHEYYRRILCNLIGEWVENGEYPWDETELGSLVEGICYKNAAQYFGI